MTSPLRILMVDPDEASASALIDRISSHRAFSLIQMCASGLEAVGATREFKPDILICEVELPGMDAFALLETIPRSTRPAAILLSRQDRFAVRAFEISAADYLVKPVSAERLMKAIERARFCIESARTSQNSLRRDTKQLVVRNGRSVEFIKCDDVDWAEAEGKYVLVHMGKDFVRLKMSISAFEAELDPEQFVRIHRSTLVNLDRVKRVQPWDRRRTYQVTLTDGTALVLSRKSRLARISVRAIPAVIEA